MNNKCKIDNIVEILKAQDLPRSDFVNFMETLKDPYQVLIYCILSLRTKDETTFGGSMRLRELGTTPLEISQRKEEEISKAIYPVGFYKNKAKQILELSKTLVEKYNSQVPCDIEELCTFKGVGRKTANLTIAKGFNQPAICVDIHVHRICNRLGYVKTKTPDETEMVLRKKLPENLWMDFNTLLVTFGQNICKPINPKCNECPIEHCCGKNLGKQGSLRKLKEAGKLRS
ncbi:MAG: endonuclease III [Candidatus Gastranaerophilales bacterium]|nr:endonuclease III [Candidatus Gastranaerophilales bacterium]